MSKVKRTVFKGMWALVDPEDGSVADESVREKRHPALYLTRAKARKGMAKTKSGRPAVVRKINLTITPAD